MGEYIEREALKKHLASYAGMFTDELGFVVSLEAVLGGIDFQPAVDAVEVVRCKDCKHLMFSDCYGECSAGHYGIVRPDHFCSYGERKEE